jgi:hypothetical protein
LQAIGPCLTVTVAVASAVVATAALTGPVELGRGQFRAQRAPGATTAISINVYGTDVTRVGSSVRRYYN